MNPSPKTALVTGGAKRIGRALVEGLAADGWAVAIHYGSSADAAAALAADIEAQGGKAVALQADLTDAGALESLIREATTALGPLGLLINNASLFEEDTAHTVTPERFDAHMAINLRAPLLLSQAFAAQLPDDALGNIINIIDQRVWRLTPRFMSYTASKAALWTVTQTLAQALAPNIRVNGIGPGPALRNDRQNPDDFEAQVRAVPLSRGPDMAEFRRTVRFIVETPSLTGQMLALDGGQHLAWQTPDATGKE
ncbi:SDR family oxidoreductase [Pyruvatibacter sp.]|uniref:SDR family oxidoreductase n=1 Tax=Pyruvatibacter sp. TaxID=1981328 RepID=UPI0032EB4D94